MIGNVLITGASRGIGRAIAEEFAKKGYNCILVCRSNIEMAEKLAVSLSDEYKVMCRAYQCDVSDSSEVRQLFEAVGTIDILVNNAGISYVGLLSEMTDDDWANTIGTNLNSVFYMCREAIPQMIKRQTGSIINISSVWGECGASMEVAYSASKGGINAFTMALAKELAPSGITVNAVACGIIDTQMNGHLSDDERAEIIDQIPANRIGKPEDIAAVVVSVAESTSYLTGQIIRVDGGWI